MKQALCIKASIVLALGFGLVAALLWLMDASTTPVTAAPALLAPSAAPNAPAAELHVCPSGCGYSSVQDAVDAANEDDVIKVAAGIYTDLSVRPRNDVTTTGVVTQVVYISKTVTIRGGYITSDWDTSDPDANPTTLDAQGQGRVLYITGDTSPTIEGLCITGGNAAGLSGTPRDEDAGGGVYVFTATAAIRDNQVSDNTSYHGGGLYLHSSTSTLSGNIVSSNIADSGGGLCLLWSDAMLSGNTVTNNTANWGGGGVYLMASDATLSGNTVSSNTGSGLQLAGSDATLSGNTVSSNTGNGLGLTGSDATISGNIVSSNTGGGLSLYRSDATLTNNIVADNHSGLHIVCSSPHLLHNTIARNGSGDGSEVYVTNAGLDCSSVAIMTNTILVNYSVGISVTGGSTVTVNGILWDSSTPITVSQSTTATVVVQNQYTGDPSFAPDGHHITAASAAMDTGVNAGVTTDVDGHHRPYGSAPDLGADEIFAPSIPPDAESTLVYTDTQGNPAVIQVPVGAVTETTNLIYIPIHTVTPPSGFLFANRAFDLDAYRGGALLPDFTFTAPVTTTLHYADADVVGRGEDTLVLKYWDGSGWADAASTCTPTSTYDRHPDENWLAVPICHLSRFALFGEWYTVYLPLVLRNY